MRKNLGLAIGAATIAIALSTGASAALATSGGRAQAGAGAAASASGHVTKALARHIALAKVPHSRVIEIESDDRHDRAVWKVTLAAGHGRVIVDVDKRTGKAVIVRGGGHADAAGATRLGVQGAPGDDRAGWSAREDRGDRRDADRRDHDGKRDHRDGDERGDDAAGR